jgi:hypothetical protein
MRLDRITHLEYSTVVDGNGGEEQLILMISAGFNGYWSIVIVRAAVAGVVQVLLDDSILSPELDGRIREVIAYWDHANAIGPDTECNVDTIVEAVLQHISI